MITLCITMFVINLLCKLSGIELISPPEVAEATVSALDVIGIAVCIIGDILLFKPMK